MTIFIGQDSLGQYIGLEMSAGAVYGIFAAVLAVMLAFHVMWAVGLTSIGRRQGIKTAWLAGFPSSTAMSWGRSPGRPTCSG